MLKIGTGLDYLSDTTKQDLVHAGTNWVPSTTYTDISPYVLAKLEIANTSLNAGLRYTSASLNVKDFTTMTTKRRAADYATTGNTELRKGVAVKGGKPNYTKALFNVGAVHNTELFRIYASYNQGFGMGDIGRVLRAINKANVTIDNNFLDIKPIITNNYEAGLDFFLSTNSMVGVEYYISNSDFGQRMEYLADQDLYKPQRAKTKVSGFNVKADIALNDDYKFGSTYSHIIAKGDYNVKDKDGKVTSTKEVDLLARYGNAPNKLSLFVSGKIGDAMSLRLQSQSLLNKTLETKPGSSVKFDGYTVIDLLGNYNLNKNSKINFGIGNVLNKQYATWYSQTGQNPRGTAYFAGEGRSFKVSYQMSF